MPRIVHGRWGYWNVLDDEPKVKKMASGKKVIAGHLILLAGHDYIFTSKYVICGIPAPLATPASFVQAIDGLATIVAPTSTSTVEYVGVHFGQKHTSP